MAKDSLARSMPSDFQTSSDVTATTGRTSTSIDLGLDYFSKYRSRLDAVTTEQAKAVGREVSRPGKDGRRRRRRSLEDSAATLQKLNLGAAELKR